MYPSRDRKGVDKSGCSMKRFAFSRGLIHLFTNRFLPFGRLGLRLARLDSFDLLPQTAGAFYARRFGIVFLVRHSYPFINLPM